MINNFINDLRKYGNYFPKFEIIEIPKPYALDANIEGGLYWINSHTKYDMVPNKSTVIMDRTSFTKLLGNDDELKDSLNVLVCDNPRLTFASIISKHHKKLSELSKPKLYSGTKHSVGNNTYIGNNVTIGKNVRIGGNCIIHDNVTIGNNVTIGDNVVIGSIGIGFERLDDGTLFKFPQIGGVLIGDNVEIGGFSDIKRGTLGNTIISNGCKLGAYNNIGHNTYMGENCLITVNCLLCGSSSLGDNVYMGTKSTVKEKIIIKNNTKIGGSAFVNKNFDGEGLTLVGIPAKIK